MLFPEPNFLGVVIVPPVPPKGTDHSASPPGIGRFCWTLIQSMAQMQQRWDRRHEELRRERVSCGTEAEYYRLMHEVLGGSLSFLASVTTPRDSNDEPPPSYGDLGSDHGLSGYFGVVFELADAVHGNGGEGAPFGFTPLPDRMLKAKCSIDSDIHAMRFFPEPQGEGTLLDWYRIALGVGIFSADQMRATIAINAGRDIAESHPLARTWGVVKSLLTAVDTENTAFPRGI